MKDRIEMTEKQRLNLLISATSDRSPHGQKLMIPYVYGVHSIHGLSTDKMQNARVVLCKYSLSFNTPSKLLPKPPCQDVKITQIPMYYSARYRRGKACHSCRIVLLSICQQVVTD